MTSQANDEEKIDEDKIDEEKVDEPEEELQKVNNLEEDSEVSLDYVSVQ